MISVSPGAEPGEPPVYWPGEGVTAGQQGPDLLPLPAHAHQLPLADLSRGPGLQPLRGGGHGAEARPQLVHHPPDIRQTIKKLILIPDILDSVEVAPLDGVLQGPHVVVGILEVDVCSVFLHQGLDNVVMTIERCYLNGAEPVLGDKVGLNMLK